MKTISFPTAISKGKVYGLKIETQDTNAFVRQLTVNETRKNVDDTVKQYGVMEWNT